jgi:hypothetical protein
MEGAKRQVLSGLLILAELDFKLLRVEGHPFSSWAWSAAVPWQQTGCTMIDTTSTASEEGLTWRRLYLYRLHLSVAPYSMAGCWCR